MTLGFALAPPQSLMQVGRSTQDQPQHCAVKTTEHSGDVLLCDPAHSPVPPSPQLSTLRSDSALLDNALRVFPVIPEGDNHHRPMAKLRSENVYDGTMERSPKRRRHGWKTASGVVGHRDLSEAILLGREVGTNSVQLRNPRLARGWTVCWLERKRRPPHESPTGSW